RRHRRLRRPAGPQRDRAGPPRPTRRTHQPARPVRRDGRRHVGVRRHLGRLHGRGRPRQRRLTVLVAGRPRWRRLRGDAPRAPAATLGTTGPLPSLGYLRWAMPQACVCAAPFPDKEHVVYIGLGIFLLVVGLVLALDVITVDIRYVNDD